MARGKYKRTGTDPSGLRARGAGSSSLVVPATAVPAGRFSAGTSKGAGVADAPVLGAAVMSPWGWRVMAVFAMVGIGVCLTCYLDGKLLFGALWTVIAGAWSVFSAFLWRKHLAWDKQR
ncbi:MAG TPA: hypothetical protein VFN61_02655 [Acidimicrobiales bacterium]|nr:hypothetical protein [Acidimicrobiales bacterium]